ncbi:MAG: hypothetical protein CO035_01930 [Candidatus Omnitrophica bacterium CG_4_9_14_0_2_um_filter_42_8]|nr:MAG: hypothetical protein CO035_01930 [Candidatus Omnitrophica bacterium CG_4_9_14_0_2_um_filter_42_8]
MIKVLSSFLVILFLAGCVTLPKNESIGSTEQNKASLSVAPILKFEDIPTPAGFRILDKESFAFQNDKSRVALLKYYGGKNAEQVMAFYKEQMASFNWNLVNVIEYDRKVLNYENSEESCIITIQPQGGKSLVTVALSPKSRPIKPEKSSIK